MEVGDPKVIAKLVPRLDQLGAGQQLDVSVRDQASRLLRDVEAKSSAGALAAWRAVNLAGWVGGAGTGPWPVAQRRPRYAVRRPVRGARRR
jgi:hypothetical protein